MSLLGGPSRPAPGRRPLFPGPDARQRVGRAGRSRPAGPVRSGTERPGRGAWRRRRGRARGARRRAGRGRGRGRDAPAGRSPPFPPPRPRTRDPGPEIPGLARPAPKLVRRGRLQGEPSRGPGFQPRLRAPRRPGASRACPTGARPRPPRAPRAPEGHRPRGAPGGVSPGGRRRFPKWRIQRAFCFFGVCAARRHSRGVARGWVI